MKVKVTAIVEVTYTGYSDISEAVRAVTGQLAGADLEPTVVRAAVVDKDES